MNFPIPIQGRPTPFKNLPDELVREFREYAIPTIEISLDDETSLDEIINLFVDINQRGARVKRFDIVKAIGKINPLLSSVFDLVAQEQIRGRAKHFKKKDTAYTAVLQKLLVVAKATDDYQKVDRMWERLFEIALYARTARHRQPSQILKTFIKEEKGSDKSQIEVAEEKKLARCFYFLEKSYSETRLGETPLATDLVHFYTMVTTLLSSSLLDADGAPPDYVGVRVRLLAFADLLSEEAIPPNEEIETALKEYREAATRQTTHPGRRAKRNEKLLEILEAL